MTHTATDHTEANTLFGAGEFFQRGNYAPVPEELTTFDLEVEGASPAEVTGWYLRNGPNPREATGHWFTGDGMIHGVRIEGGRAAWYRNRWVRTDSFEHDFPLYEEDGTRNLRASVANTHVVNHAGKTLALVESSLPYEITNDLDTVGAYDFDGKLTNSMTAHPKICPTTGEMHFFGYGSLVAPHVVYHRADADGQLVINRPLEVKALTMMHDFALTANHVVFMDLPIVFDFDIAASGSGDMPYRWDDDYGARLGLLRRDDPYGEVRWFEIDPCYVFHVANAYERGDIVVVQGVRYPELWRQNGGFDTDGMMWTWTVDLRRGTVTESQLDERAVEFPRIDDRLATLQARYAVSVGDASLVRHDLVTGDAVEHRFGTPEAPGGPGEAVFVPADGAADESSGWYLGYVYDPTRDGSDLVIIDASDFSGPPVARIKLPQRVPYGFHGNWIAD
ncbi:carotenoid oxygenase family protein [Mycolicibacterium hippocampi]|uniref:carotenoid oxygenase family protein n=1 Tax=Mycolicibacterium hippocampi TaxID=659824 RepID=UPI003518BA70